MDVLSAFLAAIIVCESIAFAYHFKATTDERRDLLNRLMANNWNTYQAAVAPDAGEVSTVDDSRERALAEAWLAEERAKQEVLSAEESAGIKLEFV